MNILTHLMKRIICFIVGHKWSLIMGHSHIKIPKDVKVKCHFCGKTNFKN